MRYYLWDSYVLLHISGSIVQTTAFYRDEDQNATIFAVPDVSKYLC